MRFAVWGVGGVGGYVGARLSEAGHDVRLIARGDHLAAIRASGLHVQSAKGDVSVRPALATSDASSVGVVDCVIVAVKAWQVPEVARSLSPLIGAHTLVLPLQNGVEAADQIADVVGVDHTLGGVAKIISFISAPGHIQHAGADPALVIGELAGGGSARVDALRDVLARSKGLVVEVSNDIRRTLWEKFIFIAAWAGVGAVTRASVGAIRRLPETRRLIEGAVLEIERLAQASEVRLASDVAAATLRFIDGLPPGGTASMQRDVAAGRPSELDNLTGAVVRFGVRLGIETPVNTFIYSALLLLEQQARGELSL
jgi:2-dehydropantoate 2-reductase